LHIQSSINYKIKRVVSDEFQALVSYLPIGTVSHEARSHAAKFCREKVNVMEVVHSIDTSNIGECDIGIEFLGCVFARPTTVMLTKSSHLTLSSVNRTLGEPGNDRSPKLGVGYRSAEHLIEAVSRLFGSCVEHIVLNFWADHNAEIQGIFWSHTLPTRKAKKAAE
jgi:hypothetical protein